MDIELTFNFLGFSACVLASAYVFLKANKLAGALLVVGFCLHIQTALYINYASTENMGACWYEKESYYECLPLGYKLSIHAGQLGHYLIAVGIFLLGRHAVRSRSVSS